MLVYVILAIIAILFLRATKKCQDIVSVTLMTVMMVLCGLRGRYVGTDTLHYMGYVEGSFTGQSFGFVYEFLREVSLVIGSNPNIFLMILAVLTYIPLMLLIVRESNKPVLSVYLFMTTTGLFFLETFNIARQSIAIVFILWSAVFLNKKRYLWSFIFFILGFCFHPYVFPFIIMYVLNKIVLKKWMVAICLSLSFLVGFWGVLDRISDVIELLYAATSGSESVLVEQLGKYSGRDTSYDYSFLGKMRHMLPITLLCWFSYSSRFKNELYFKMLLIGAIIVNLFIATQYCERIASTFTLSQILVIPIALQNGNYFKKISLIVLLFLVSILYLYNLNGMQNNDFEDYPVPYKTCFQD